MSEQVSKDEQLKTLSCIEHVLRLYWSPNWFEAEPNAIAWLIQHGLIEVNAYNTWWEVTEKGSVYVEAIRNVPLPVQVTEWRMPE